jgi:hypothetical protein
VDEETFVQLTMKGKVLGGTLYIERLLGEEIIILKRRYK